MCWLQQLAPFYDNVALPDGKRSGLLVMADPEHELWRVKLNGKNVYGTLTKRNDDFVFVISDKQVDALNFAENILYQQLLQCEGIVPKVENPVFANDLYGAFAGNIWDRSDFKHELSARSAGKVVAKMRGKNECYADFFGSGLEGEVQNHIDSILCSYGFRLTAQRDFNADAGKAKDLLKVCEARPGKESPPRWFSMWVGELGASKGPMERMLQCCFRGQVTLGEWEEFYILSSALDN